jgi:hypothetical protein
MADTVIATADVLAIDAALARDTGSGSYGLTRAGFVPKPFARLLAEKLALARALLGDDLDLGSGSVVRKLLEVSALEDARTWSALAAMYDDQFVSSATGAALSRLGEELCLPRPYLQAAGNVTLTLKGPVPSEDGSLELPNGARMLTPGGHHVALDERVVLSHSSPTRDVAVVAFYPGPEHNLDPAQASEKIDRLNPDDTKLSDVFSLQSEASGLGQPFTLKIDHKLPLTGGELQWPDARYRDLLLMAPRSVWTVDALQTAVTLVAGVRRAQVRDLWGGLDIEQSIFGDFDFIERLFASERDIASPYYVSVLVAPTPAAIWSGPDGLEQSVESAIEDLRPIGIFPQVQQAEQVSVGIDCQVKVSGLPLPGGSQATVNASEAAQALKTRLLGRAARYVESLGFGEPVRAAELTWALMNEPGVEDISDLTLVRYPPDFVGNENLNPLEAQAFGCGANVEIQANQVPVLHENLDGLVVR